VSGIGHTSGTQLTHESYKFSGTALPMGLLSMGQPSPKCIDLHPSAWTWPQRLNRRLTPCCPCMACRLQRCWQSSRKEQTRC
jgi:hypothetical protein